MKGAWRRRLLALRKEVGAACRWPERTSLWPPGRRQEPLHGSRAGQEGAQVVTSQEGCKSLDLIGVLLVEIFVNSWKELAAGHWLVDRVAKTLGAFLPVFWDSHLLMKYFPHI